MKRLRLAAAGLVLLSLGVSAGAQDAPGGNEILSNGNLVHSLRAAPVLGQPFSATASHSVERKLADGTTISHRGHHFFARDSEGRIRVEMRMGHGKNGAPDPITVFVIDPVSHRLTVWTTGVPGSAKVATTIKLPAHRNQGQPQKLPPANPNRPRPVVTTQNLGPDTLQGIPVTVVLRTKIVPAGRVGNDAPMTSTVETWTSPDLQLLMKEQWDDPRIGEKIVELDNVSRSEPDPALFHPPADHVVKTMRQTLQGLMQKLNATQD